MGVSIEWLKGVFEGRRTNFEIERGGFKEVFDERERGVLRFLERVVDGPEIEDELWEETRRWFSEREVVELISLQVSSSVPCSVGGETNEC